MRGSNSLTSPTALVSGEMGRLRSPLPFGRPRLLKIGPMDGMM